MTDIERENIQRTLGRIEGQLNGVAATQEKMLTRVTRQDDKITRIENKLHWFSGGIALLAGSLAMFRDKIVSLFHSG